MIVDKHGVIGQIQDDGVTVEGGDSINWMAHWAYHEDVPNWPADRIVEKFEVGFGGYVRHFDPAQTYYGFGAHYKNPYNGVMSRDQMTGLIGMLVKRGQKMALARIMLHNLSRLFLFSYNSTINGRDTDQTKFNLIKFFYNPAKENYYKLPDLTGPDVLAMQLRGFGKASWLAWPLLVFLDLHNLLNVGLDRFQEDDDVISMVMKYQVSRDFIPTPTSWLTSKLMNKKQVTEKLKSYWTGWRKQPRMYELMVKHLNENR